MPQSQVPDGQSPPVPGIPPHLQNLMAQAYKTPAGVQYAYSSPLAPLGAQYALAPMNYNPALAAGGEPAAMYVQQIHDSQMPQEYVAPAANSQATPSSN